jgi:hypothetical protein
MSKYEKSLLGFAETVDTMQTKLLMEFKKNQDEQFEKQKALEFQLQDREDARHNEFLRVLNASNRTNIQNPVIFFL